MNKNFVVSEPAQVIYEYPYQINAGFIDELHKRLAQELKRLNRISGDGFDSALLPSREHLAELIQVAFWASLQKEEGRDLTFSLVYSPAHLPTRWESFRFEQPLSFSLESCIKLAPALMGFNQSLAVGVVATDHLGILGISSKGLSLNIDARDPGSILISFENLIAQITAAKAGFIERDMLWRLVPWQTMFGGIPAIQLQAAPAVGDLIRAVRRHGHGGTLLVVPRADEEKWKNSIEFPTAYSGVAPMDLTGPNMLRLYSTMRNSAESLTVTPNNLDKVEIEMNNLRSSLRFMGQLTAVDGAVVIYNDFSVPAFGVKIKKIDMTEKGVALIEPFEGLSPTKIELRELGNTRHQSACHFVAAQRDSMAIVCSQDGKVTLLLWDSEEEIIQAVRPADVLFS